MPGLKLSPLTHFASLFVAALIGVVTFWTTTATAATGNGYYRAELANPASPSKFVARGVVWKCTDTGCIAGRGTSRPVIMCASLVREVGAVTGFVADGKALDADELAKCNGQK